jgi:cbb3-type cytochrome oxidase maturation protein
MEVLVLTVFASVVMGVAAVLFFAWNVRQRAHEHTEHLALLPLADDERNAANDSDEERS